MPGRNTRVAKRANHLLSVRCAATFRHRYPAPETLYVLIFEDGQDLPLTFDVR